MIGVEKAVDIPAGYEQIDPECAAWDLVNAQQRGHRVPFHSASLEIRNDRSREVRSSRDVLLP